MTPLLWYLAAVNLLGLVLMGADKAKARRGARRIPEKFLLAAAIIGGSIGSLAGMYLFRHKTRHKKFFIGIPVIILLQLAAVWAASYLYPVELL